MNAAVFEVVAKYGGSISAEHGIGVIKRDLLPKVKDPVAFDLMRTLKRTLDPKGILNPGQGAVAQNSEDCRSSVFGFLARLAGVPPLGSGAASAPAVCAEAGSISVGPSLSARLTAGEIS